ncbi:hypothetical protein ACEWY4_012989 [Coilia grayii]|uniref:AXH domain-containing protein n=1 Tax=Coilia grayii TaxID=363190 RepID=A0ABD1JV05_9TELE
MSASPHLTGFLPLKKRTQPQDSSSGCMEPPGQPYQQQQQQQQQQLAGSPPSQLEHTFKVPAPYRHPGRATGGRARPERSLGTLVAPAPLYYRFWDQSYVALPRNHSSVSALAGGGHAATPWRERFHGNGHMMEWTSGRTIQEVASPTGASLHANYLTTAPPDTDTHLHLHGYTYRDPQLLGGHRRSKVSDGDPSAFHTHRGLSGASSSPYENRGVAGWDRRLVPMVRTNHLLYGLAKPGHHDSTRRRRERYLMEDYYSRAFATHSVQMRATSPVNGKSPHTTSVEVRSMADTCQAEKEHLSPSNSGCHSGNTVERAETQKNSDRPLLVGSGSAEEDDNGQHNQCSKDPETERKAKSSSTPCASALGPHSLQHFAVGSLIELSGGRCKRVEELQTEDFLLCADACPQIRLRSCTVRNISPSSSSPELAQVAVLLDDQHTQDCLEVFVGFPFFVCGRGWASCCPQKTAHLWGLCCHQLCLGDVCLALSPSSGTPSLATVAASTPLEQPEQKRTREGEKKQETCCHGGTEKGRTVRKRHSSAPQLGITS